jgi:hypothetical protein
MDDERTARADEIWKSIAKPDDFMLLVERSDPEVLHLLIARLGSTGATGASWEALRDAVNAVMNSRLSANQVAAMDRLDRSTTLLAKVGIAVAAVGVAVSVIQIIIAIWFK